MKDLIEILKYVIPAAIVGVFFMVYLRSFFEEEDKKRRHEAMLRNRDISLPIRLQAYERLALLLERITLVNLIRKAPTSIDSVELMRYYLVNQISEEFDHNLSQQIYVSADLWNMIRTAKNATIVLVNTTHKSLNNEQGLQDFKSILITDNSSNDDSPTKLALSMLKDEVSREL